MQASLGLPFSPPSQIAVHDITNATSQMLSLRKNIQRICITITAMGHCPWPWPATARPRLVDTTDAIYQTISTICDLGPSWMLMPERHLWLLLPRLRIPCETSHSLGPRPRAAAAGRGRRPQHGRAAPRPRQQAAWPRLQSPGPGHRAWARSPGSGPEARVWAQSPGVGAWAHGLVQIPHDSIPPSNTVWVSVGMRGGIQCSKTR